MPLLLVGLAFLYFADEYRHAHDNVAGDSPPFLFKAITNGGNPGRLSRSSHRCHIFHRTCDIREFRVRFPRRCRLLKPFVRPSVAAGGPAEVRSRQQAANGSRGRGGQASHTYYRPRHVPGSGEVGMGLVETWGDL